MYKIRCLVTIFLSLFFFGGCVTGYDFDHFYSNQNLKNHSAKKPWSITIQNEIVRAGTGAVRFELRPNDGWGDGYYPDSRAELSESIKVGIGNDIWYGFSMFIAKDYPIDESRSLVCGQWHQSSRSGRPPLARYYIADQEELAISFRPGVLAVRKIDNFKMGQWNDLVYNIKWTKDKSGYLNIWHNGKQKIRYTGPTYYPNEKMGPYFKFGLYQIGTHPEQKRFTHVIYFDEYRRGRSYEEVDPSQNDSKN